MEPIRVHIAELVIAEDPAAADISAAEVVSERATAANIAVVAREIVKDAEVAIRTQLEALIARADVDVVIVTSVAESTQAGLALKPLVDEIVPGFTDLFRWLAFQEIGAAAMHSNAEAVRCQDTFVFVLPAVTGAVGSAMDKLILPQLDPKTRPKNLITRIPRLAPLVAAVETQAVPEQVEGARTEAVPTQIGPEKTESGAGIVPRAPARSPVAANVVRKESGDVTKQIDRAQLERSIETSNANDSPTRPAIDIRSMLPRVPPGADDTFDDDNHDVGDTTDVTTPLVAPAPLARVKLVQRPSIPSLPSIPSVIPSVPKPVEKKARPDTNPSPPPAGMKTDEQAAEAAKQVAAVVARVVARVAEDSAAHVTKPAPRKPEVVPLDALARMAESDNAPTKIKSIADVQAERKAADAATKIKSVAEVAAEREIAAMQATKIKPVAEINAEAKVLEGIERDSGPVMVVSRKPVEDEPPAPAKPDRAATTELTADDLDAIDDGPTSRAPAVLREARTRPPTAPPKKRVTAEVPVAAKRRAPTEPPPVPAKRAPTGQVPVARAPTGQVPVVARSTRTPTEPPPPRELDDLPRGKFVYPTKKSMTVGRLVMWALLALLAAAGGIAFVHFFIMKPEEPSQVANNNPPPPPPPAPDAALVAPPIDAAEVVAVTPDAAEIEIEAPAPPDAAVTTHHTTHTQVTTHTPVTHQRDAGVSAPPAVDAAVVAAGSNTPPSDPTCDEVSCVLEKYARPCCARYKPSDSGFKPKGALPDELDKAMVRAGVNTVKPRVIACGEKGGAKGTVKVSLTVGPDGVVKDASVVESPAPDLGSCVATALRAAKFDKSSKGGSFTYPFVF